MYYTIDTIQIAFYNIILIFFFLNFIWVNVLMTKYFIVSKFEVQQ